MGCYRENENWRAEIGSSRNKKNEKQKQKKKIAKNQKCQGPCVIRKIHIELSKKVSPNDWK